MIVRDAASGRLLRVNRAFTEQLEYEADDLVDTPVLEWIHPEDRARFQQALDRGDGGVRGRHRTRGGGWVAFDWQVRSEEQGPVVLGVLDDGGRVAAKRPSAQPGRPRDTMHDILEAMVLIIESERPGMKCSVLLLDADGRRVSVGAGPNLPADYNEAVEGLMIGPGVGSCGTASYWNEPIIVEDIQKDPLWEGLRELAADAGLGACWSHPIRSQSGEVLGATALYDSNPRAPTQQELDALETAARMFALAIERGRAEQREWALEQQLHQAAKMEALGVLAGGLAHDFNNVLATVMGNAELVLSAVPKGSTAAEMLCDIVTASRNATALCNQMLAYAGRGVLSTRRLEFNGLIREFGRLLKVTLSKKATLSYRLSDDALFVEGDKAQLGQVLMNLITNAAEALGKDASRILVTTGARSYSESELEGLLPKGTAGGQYVCLTVSDTGSGMDAATQAKIYDPFFTTKFTGHGLGLAAVRGIVKRHGGAIRLESQPGEGTTFTVLLPRAEAPRRALQAKPRHPAVNAGKRVLIVDDEQQVRKVLGRILDDAGFDTILARDGREAIEIFRKQSEAIDCVLLDLSMPVLDGEETFRELQKIQPDVRVVLSSGFTEKEIVNRFEGAGFAGILQKPTPLNELIAKIEEVLG